MMSWQNFISWLLSVCWEGGRVKETAIVGRDSISFRVVDRLEANPNERPVHKSYDLPNTDKKNACGKARHSPD